MSDFSPPIEHSVQQGSDEWLALRCGLITASEVKLLMTPGRKPADNDRSRQHLYELAAQRVASHVEPQYISDAMLRGHDEELAARDLYSRKYAPVREAGFITRDFGDVVIGYSPDGLVGADGLIEVKSRAQKYQLQTAIGCAAPDEFRLQMQTGLLVTGRDWCDFLSYSAGMPMVVFCEDADEEIQDAILATCRAAEARIRELTEAFRDSVQRHGWHATERPPRYEEIFV